MASTGAEKWNKYFSGGCKTILKEDTPLFDLYGKDLGITLKKGDSIDVFGGDYSAKPRIMINGVEGRVRLANLEKPIHLAKTVKFDLKPDKIGVQGLIKMKDYPDMVKELIHSNTEIHKSAKKYLINLVTVAQDLSSSSHTLLEKSFLEIQNDKPLINTINRDFMEVLGPLISINHDKKFLSSQAFFPVAGNEPLYDFKLIFRNKEELFSSKKSTGSTNTLKASLILDRCEKINGFDRELELFRIIKENKVKETPNIINEWLDKTFLNYKRFKPASSCEEIVKLEANVVKYINDSDLNFIPLIKNAIPDVWYVKAQLSSTGALTTKPLIKAGEITKVILRSKSSPNHICDKLGFQI